MERIDTHLWVVRAHNHSGGGDNKDDRRLYRVFLRQPDGDGNVVFVTLACAYVCMCVCVCVCVRVH
jgi:hypothetical protein